MPYDPFPDTFPTLCGRGLTLRELGEDDLPAWYQRLSDAEAAALAGDPPVTSMEDLTEALAAHRAAFRDKEGLRWAIVPEAPGVSVGSIGLGHFSQGRRNAGIGGAIGRAYWGRGLATRAARLVLDYGFSALSLETVEAVVLPENPRVIRVLEKLGFVSVQESITAPRTIGERADTLVYRLERASRDSA